MKLFTSSKRNFSNISNNNLSRVSPRESLLSWNKTTCYNDSIIVEPRVWKSTLFQNFALFAGGLSPEQKYGNRPTADIDTQCTRPNKGPTATQNAAVQTQVSHPAINTDHYPEVDYALMASLEEQTIMNTLSLMKTPAISLKSPENSIVSSVCSPEVPSWLWNTSVSPLTSLMGPLPACVQSTSRLLCWSSAESFTNTYSYPPVCGASPDVVSYSYQSSVSTQSSMTSLSVYGQDNSMVSYSYPSTNSSLDSLRVLPTIPRASSSMYGQDNSMVSYSYPSTHSSLDSLRVLPTTSLASSSMYGQDNSMVSYSYPSTNSSLDSLRVLPTTSLASSSLYGQDNSMVSYSYPSTNSSLDSLRVLPTTSLASSSMYGQDNSMVSYSYPSTHSSLDSLRVLPTTSLASSSLYGQDNSMVSYSYPSTHSSLDSLRVLPTTSLASSSMYGQDNSMVSYSYPSTHSSLDSLRVLPTTSLASSSLYGQDNSMVSYSYPSTHSSMEYTHSYVAVPMVTSVRTFVSMGTQTSVAQLVPSTHAARDVEPVPAKDSTQLQYYFTETEVITTHAKIRILAKHEIRFRRDLKGEYRVLGKGTFGCVYMAKLGALDVAVKVYFNMSTEVVPHIMNEVMILALLQNTGFVPKLYGVYSEDPQSISMVQELYGDGCTLESAICGLTSSRKINVAYQLVYALKAIHEKGVLINDIKTNNILVDTTTAECRIRYIDFGLATYRSGHTYTNTFALVMGGGPDRYPFLSPESKMGIPTTPAADVFSMGYAISQLQCRALREVARVCTQAEAYHRPPLAVVLDMMDQIMVNVT